MRRVEGPRKSTKKSRTSFFIGSKRQKGSLLAIKEDVTEPQEVAKMVKEVQDRWNAIDVLMTNAGGFHQIASSAATPSIPCLPDSSGSSGHSFPPILEITAEQWE